MVLEQLALLVARDQVVLLVFRALGQVLAAPGDLAARMALAVHLDRLARLVRDRIHE